MHYGIALWAYLSQTHRLIALHCMHYGITLWEYLSQTYRLIVLHYMHTVLHCGHTFLNLL